MDVVIPKLVQHVSRDGTLLFDGAVATDAATPAARTALAHLDSFVSFVHGRVPEALDQVRAGLSLIVDERVVDDAVAKGSSVTLGRAGVRFLGDPIDSPAVVGHELTHALTPSAGNYLSEELNADLVGLAYARSLGSAESTNDAWRVAMVDRDLRRPTYATVDELKAASTLDTHLMAGPVGAAVARAADVLGVDAVDAITIEAALRDMPRTSAAVAARIDELIWSGRPTSEIEHAIVDVALGDHAAALLAAATRRHGASSTPVQALTRELQASGIAT